MSGCTALCFAGNRFGAGTPPSDPGSVAASDMHTSSELQSAAAMQAQGRRGAIWVQASHLIRHVCWMSCSATTSPKEQIRSNGDTEKQKNNSMRNSMFHPCLLESDAGRRRSEALPVKGAAEAVPSGSGGFRWRTGSSRKMDSNQIFHDCVCFTPGFCFSFTLSDLLTLI